MGNPWVEALNNYKVIVDNLNVTYLRDNIQALRNLNFYARPGEFLVVLGPSGCGKTTLLNVIAGLLKHRRDVIISGKVIVNGIDVLNEKGPMRVGYVTQKDTLLPWRTILENIEVGLEISGVSRKKRRRLVIEFLRKVGLEEFKDSYPYELSGGMRKRVMLARALVYNPDIILMDEPFASLDAQTRLMLHEEVLRLWRAHRTTIIFVTHDIDEAITLADRIILLTARPGTIKAIYKVNIPRPRSVHTVKLSDSFRELYERIWNGLKEEVLGGRS